MKIRIDYIYALIICFIASLPLAVQGGFQDSLVYYGQANNVWNYGLLDGIRFVYIQTGKLEWGLQAVFYIEGLFLKDITFFLILNGTLVNLCLFYMATQMSSGNKYNFKLGFCSIFILIFSYFVYSNTLYVWRTIISILFFYYYVASDNRFKKVIFIILAISFHYTAILFILFYFISHYLPKSKCILLFSVFILSVSICLMINYIPYINLFVSGGDAGLFLVSQGDFVKRIIINTGLLVSLLLVNQQREDRINFRLYQFSIMLCCSALVFSFNWQLSWRLFVPAAIIGICLSVSHIKKNKPLFILLFLSCVPSLKLMILLLSGVSP